jgi:TIR domain-containing protein/carbohydrate binding protein with CBM35 domain
LPLARELKRRGISVWLDNQQLTIGDSLSRKIDEGLARARFGVVVLSRSFFAKHWPQKELEGLETRETATGTKVILPVWHGVKFEDVTRYSLTLAARLAADTRDGIPATADQIQRALEAAPDDFGPNGPPPARHPGERPPRQVNWVAVTALATVVLAAVAVIPLLKVFDGGPGASQVGNSHPPTGAPCVFDAQCTADEAALHGTHVDSDWQGHSGNGYVAGFEQAGARATWTIRKVPAAGKYRLEIRYANYQGSDGRVTPRQLTLETKGKTRRIVRFSTTPSWASWTDASVTLRLGRGSNMVALVYGPQDSGRVNIDWIKAS